MTRIKEGNLAFEFGKRWSVFKLDEHQFYRKYMDKVDETKSVDFLGILDSKELYLIEIKDFRGHRIENKEKLSTGSLSTEFAQKIKDSLACIIGGYRSSSNSEAWLPYKNLVCNKERKLKAILWLEHDLPNHSRQKEKVKASIQTKAFKTKLRWITTYVLVCNCSMNGLPDLKVTNI